MKHYRSTAVVLRAMDFRESDRMVTLMTRDFGKIRAVAKGAKRSRKRGFGTLQIFAHLRVDVVEGSKSPIPRIDSMALLHPFYGLAEDPALLGYGAYLLEIVDGYCRQFEPFPRVFDLLVAFLARLDRGDPAERVLRIFELLAADGFGFRPNLDTCVVSGEPIPAARPCGFSVALGGAVHPDRMAGRSDCAPMSIATRAAMRRLLDAPRTELDQVPIDRRSLLEMRAFLPPFVEAQLGTALKSKSYLKQVLASR